jgi:hypothetical protein
MNAPEAAAESRFARRAALPALVVGVAALVGIQAAVSMAEPTVKRTARICDAAASITAATSVSGFDASPLMLCSAVVLAACLLASARTPSAVFAPTQLTARLIASPTHSSRSRKIQIAYHLGGLYGP